MRSTSPGLPPSPFGALISATDPVAVIAFFKSLGTPKRLSVLVEGESLFNDAVAVVAFGLAVAAAEGEGFTVGGAAVDFVVVSAGGLLVGVVLGYLVGEIFLSRVDDPLIETSTTLALAYGSFLLAEEAGAIVGQPRFPLLRDLGGCCCGALWWAPSDCVTRRHPPASPWSISGSC